MNAESSRSHLIIGIVMESTNKNTGNVTKGKVCYYILTYLDSKNFCIRYFLWYKMAIYLYYRIYLAIRRGFHLSRMTTNNLISSM